MSSAPIPKVEAMPGIPLTPGMLLSELVGDVENIDMLICLVRDKQGQLSLCSAGANVSDLAMGALVLQARAMQFVGDDPDINDRDYSA